MFGLFWNAVRGESLYVPSTAAELVVFRPIGIKWGCLILYYYVANTAHAYAKILLQSGGHQLKGWEYVKNKVNVSRNIMAKNSSKREEYFLFAFWFFNFDVLTAASNG